MGGKRKKLKDMISPSTPPPTVEDDELLDDLFAQLDSNNQTVQDVSAEVINDIQLSQLQEKEPQKPKKDSKMRFLERQVRMFPRVSTIQTTISFPRHGELQRSLNNTLPATLRRTPR
jgi:hypothetical protein